MENVWIENAQQLVLNEDILFKWQILKQKLQDLFFLL